MWESICYLKAHLSIVKTLLKRRAEGVHALPNSRIYCKARIIRTVWYWCKNSKQSSEPKKGGQKQNLGNKGNWNITPQWEISELFSAQLGELPHFKEKNQLQSHSIDIKNLEEIKILTLKSNVITPVEGNVSSVAQSCPTLCDPMNRSTPGLSVHHQLWSLLKLMSIESWPSHPLSSPSPPAPNPSQHQGLFQ